MTRKSNIFKKRLNELCDVCNCRYCVVHVRGRLLLNVTFGVVGSFILFTNKKKKQIHALIIYNT